MVRAPITSFGSNDPTAKFHEIIADVAQQIISPVQISQFIPFNAATGWTWSISGRLGVRGWRHEPDADELDGPSHHHQHQYDAIVLL